MKARTSKTHEQAHKRHGDRQNSTNRLLSFHGVRRDDQTFAPHLPPPPRQVERREGNQSSKRPSGKRGRRLGAGALLGDSFMVSSITLFLSRSAMRFGSWLDRR